VGTYLAGRFGRGVGMTPIPSLATIGIRPRPLNDRLWELIAKERDGTITAPEQLEINLMFLAMETTQENAA
jgi:hypothetical protein